MESELREVRDAVAGARLPLQTAHADVARAHRNHLLAQLDDYVLPRAASLDAPLLVVVGGSTGAGKSTLVNALVGEPVATTGALRPTTRDPLLIHHPGDAGWFVPTRVLPHLARVRGSGARQDRGTGGVVRLLETDAVGPGLALLDAPDIDSVVDANRELAGQLLAAADLWIFVTTAHRYADAVPWGLLREAARRDVAVAVVLDRVAPAVRAEVSGDLTQMLADEGLGGAPLFVVAETRLSGGMLPPEYLTDLARWLAGLSADSDARAQLARQTLHGAVRDVAQGAADLAGALEEQRRLAIDLRGRVAGAYDTSDLLRTLADGALLRTEVLARWQDFVGTGDFIRSVESTVGRARDRVTAFVTGRPQPARKVEDAIGHGVLAVLVDQAGTAAEHAYQALSREPAGRALVAGAAQDGTSLDRASPDIAERAGEQIRGWQHYLLELVRTEGQDKRTTARMLAFGVNGVAVVLMIVAFATTGGALLGSEVAIAGGAAVVAQKLLEAIFGDQAVRRLAEQARADLDTRVQTLFAQEQGRYETLLPDTGRMDTAAQALRTNAASALAALAAVERA
ncbi:dynamin family protein [Ruania suaedae]|uniref:dynamin family protein n=1 Tax=Ruania suaedae TaxID=2897774 RepID=UPI001E47D026|nr:dynamin family protein [Ruania suaedae]UFU01565.1 dynamin family protein [Ruania suaedae]